MTATGYQVPANLYRDPTAVVGTRILAWIIDAILYMALMLLFIPPLSPLAEKTDVPEGMTYEEACDERLSEAEDAQVCLLWGDEAYWTDGDDSIIQALASIGWFVAVFVLLQGLKGFTPGKALVGLRVVGEDGQVPGIGKALVRSLLWVVDGQPCGIPLVGFILALATTGHRRLGDMAANTYVVTKADVGRPVHLPGATPRAPMPGYGVAPPAAPPPPGGPGAPPGTGPAWPTSPPTAPTPTPPGATPSWGSWGQTPPGPEPTTPSPAPGAPETTPTPSTPGPGETGPAAGAEGGPGPYGGEGLSPTGDAGASGPEADLDTTIPVDREGDAGGPEADAAPSDAGPEAGAADSPAAETEPSAAEAAPPTAEQPATAEQPTSGGTAGTMGGPSEAPTYQPQWDAARGTYIQWDPNRNHWLQWDDTAKEWKAL